MIGIAIHRLRSKLGLRDVCHPAEALAVDTVENELLRACKTMGSV